VARALAAPSLTVPANEAVTSSSSHQQQQQQGSLQLPRGEVLLIGGDLAYPNPSRETYETRLFVPFQEAMPPPPHYHPGALTVLCLLVRMLLLEVLSNVCMRVVHTLAPTCQLPG
jgi:hypothetical protein